MFICASPAKPWLPRAKSSAPSVEFSRNRRAASRVLQYIFNRLRVKPCTTGIPYRKTLRTVSVVRSLVQWTCGSLQRVHRFRNGVLCSRCSSCGALKDVLLEILFSSKLGMSYGSGQAIVAEAITSVTTHGTLEFPSLVTSPQNL